MVTRKDTGNETPVAQIVVDSNTPGFARFIGIAAGVIFGLYYSTGHGKDFIKNSPANAFFWSIIFGLAFYEIGEQVDRRMGAVMTTKAS